MFPLALCFASFAAVPLLAIETTAIALHAADPASGPPVREQLSTAEMAKAECAEDGAGANPECVAYMTQRTGSYY
jgi:hypothetical protein